MRLSKSRADRSIKFNMTPMIDIVFLLIIFFMTVSQITRTIDHPVELPTVPFGGQSSQPTSITINIDQQGNIVVGGNRLSMESVLAAIRTRLKKHDNDPNQIRINLRCDRRCESRHVNELLEKLSAMGFTQIKAAISDG